MEGFLGETPVNVAMHPEFSRWTAGEWAMLFVTKYGQIDGEHHKTWVLDQVSRILHGTTVKVTQAHWSNGQTEYRFVVDEPSQAYLDWREQMLGRSEPTGEPEYTYDEGIAP